MITGEPNLKITVLTINYKDTGIRTYQQRHSQDKVESSLKEIKIVPLDARPNNKERAEKKEEILHWLQETLTYSRQYGMPGY